jgi:16S rRNA C967 or C1407 C5-methylase (RsmB/RsmF family)
VQEGKHYIAALMENKGQLIAMDLYESKLKQLIKQNVMVLLILNIALLIQQKSLKITSKSRSCTY